RVRSGQRREDFARLPRSAEQPPAGTERRGASPGKRRRRVGRDASRRHDGPRRGGAPVRAPGPRRPGRGGPPRAGWGRGRRGCAAREGDIESTTYLLDAGADVNRTTEYGWTPLLTATNNRHYQLGAYLLSRGANPNIANKGGWTPLYLATDNRNIEGGDYPVP